MSSPIAKARKSPLDRAVVAFHQGVSHSHRVEILSSRIASVLQTRFDRGVAIRLLDIGCGDLSIAEMIAGLRPDTHYEGVDIHPLPRSLETAERWSHYHRFDGRSIPFDDHSFSVATLCDVLHHADPDDRLALLKDALRVAPHVIVKDHFESGFISRQVLRAMDFVGNYGYGVSVPKRYFTESSFNDLVREGGGRIDEMHSGLELYSHLPLGSLVFRSEWQFLAELSKPG